MAGFGYPGVEDSPLPALMSRQERVRQALFGTLPGRAMVVGLAVKLLVGVVEAIAGSVPAFLSVVDTVAGLAIAAGALYFVFLLLLLAKRRLLWRVRRKLILSYIFIGFVPAILIVAFFLLGGLLLFYNVSSYLVQCRLQTIEDQGRLVAQSTAVEIQRASGRDTSSIIARRQESAARDFPARRLSSCPSTGPCAQSGAASSGGGRRRRHPAGDGRVMEARRAAPRSRPGSIAAASAVCSHTPIRRLMLPRATRRRPHRPPYAAKAPVSRNRRRTRTCSCVRRRFQTRRLPATRSSSICWSTTR
jgi:hypothetical protein